jgi:hypothetical protein
VQTYAFAPSCPKTVQKIYLRRPWPIKSMTNDQDRITAREKSAR